MTKNNLTYGVETRDNREYFRMIRAYIIGKEDKEVGHYRFDKVNWEPVAEGEIVMSGWMNSYISGIGIPRGLFNKSIEVLQDLANEKSKRIEHQTSAVNKNTGEIADHLLAEFKYEKYTQDDDIFYVREYHSKL